MHTAMQTDAVSAGLKKGNGKGMEKDMNEKGKKFPKELMDLPRKEEFREDLMKKWHPVVRMEQVDVDDAENRILAKDQTALYSFPVCRCSAMDGIAVKSAMFSDGMPDLPQMAAGRDFQRADTGDDFPDCYDAVIRIEDVVLDEDGNHIKSIRDGLQVKAGMNIRSRGAFIQEGKTVVSRGTCLTPEDLSMLVLAGKSSIPVFVRPKVAFIPTGSELVPAGSVPGRGQMLDSNSMLMKHTLLNLGAEPLMHPIVKDDRRLLEQEVEAAVDEGADIIILNGGSSKGSEDFNVETLKKHGTLLYHGAATVPGRPVAAVLFSDHSRIGIVQPGPALACFNVLEWLIRPLIADYYGIRPREREKVRAVLTEEMHGPKIFDFMSHMHLVQKTDGQYLASPAGGRHAQIPDSFHTEGCFYHPYGCDCIPKGTEIEVMLKRNRNEIPEENDGQTE